MKIPGYHLDAFAGKVFSGNPAMVCPLDDWVDDEQLQLIAMENHLPATAFFVAKDDHYELRWFTPTMELNICGHGTLAAAAVIFNGINPSKASISFRTKSGEFNVTKDGQRVCMDLPAHKPVLCSIKPDDLVRALGREPMDALKSSNYLAVFDREEDIRNMTPDMALLKELDCLGVIVTSKGENSDFVSRYFAPRIGLPEDAATGSTHCTLAPYWAEKLGKRQLHALQLSQRGGELWCEYLGDRVRISGQVIRYAESFLYL